MRTCFLLLALALACATGCCLRSEPPIMGPEEHCVKVLKGQWVEHGGCAVPVKGAP